MTTRESLHALLDRLSDEEVEALARFACERGLDKRPADTSGDEPATHIDAAQYPALAAIWDNDDDVIFDTPRSSVSRP